MIPAILNAVGRVLLGRSSLLGELGSAGAARAGSAAAARAGRATSAAQMAERRQAIKDTMLGGGTPKEAMRAGDRAQQQQRLREQETASRRAAEAVGQFTEATQKAIHPVQSMIKPIDMLTSHASRLTAIVGKWNPGVANQAVRSADNLMAAAGKVFTPVLRGVTSLMDSMNRFYTGMEPIMRPAMESIERLLRALGETLVEMGPDAAKTVKAYADAVVSVTDATREALPYLKSMADIAYAVARLRPLAIGGMGGFLGSGGSGGKSFYRQALGRIGGLTGGLLGNTISAGTGLYDWLNGDSKPEALKPNFTQMTAAVRQPALVTEAEQLGRDANLAGILASSGKMTEAEKAQKAREEQLKALLQILDIMNRWTGGGKRNVDRSVEINQIQQQQDAAWKELSGWLATR